MSITDISEQEDAILTAITGLNAFKVVASIGRKAKPAALNFPAAFACFIADSQMQAHPRHIMRRQFGVAIVVQNLAGEKPAADSLYDLIDKVLGVLMGKTLSLTGISPLQYRQGAIEEYEDGRISFLLVLETNVYLPVVKN